MKINTTKTPEGRAHKCTLGELVVHGKCCVLFPAAFCGTVGIEVTRIEAARGLREWRKIKDARVIPTD